jgi:hypothetical protein
MDPSLWQPRSARGRIGWGKTMEKSEFEKKFLAFVYQSNAVITAPTIAYQLEIPIEEAQEQLLGLELTGTIQQATDPQGNTYYVMPNRPAAGAIPGAGLKAQASGGPPGVYNPADLPSAPVYSNPAVKGKNLNAFVLNVILPGVGSIVCGNKIGFAMLALVLLGLFWFFFPLGLFGRAFGVVPIAAGWIWSIVAGIGLLSEKEGPPGIPS